MSRRGGDVSGVLLGREACCICTLDALSPGGLRFELDFDSCF